MAAAKRRTGSPTGRKKRATAKAAKPSRPLKGRPKKRAAARPLAQPCVDRPDAEDIVFGCAGGVIDVDTKLGVLFPNPTEREKFCRCVSEGSGVPRSRIPCGPGASIEDVIEAITC